MASDGSDETFTFVVCTDESYATEVFFGSRHYADKKFDAICRNPSVSLCAYYAPSIGGQVNAYHRD